MTAPLALSGEYADLKLIKTRSVMQVIIEIPVEQGEQIVRLFGIPQPGKPVHVALARLAEPNTIEPERRRTFDQLLPAQQAGIRCNEPRFRKFLQERHETAWMLALSNNPDDLTEAAAVTVRALCGVHSRAELSQTPTAEIAWISLQQEFDHWLRT